MSIPEVASPGSSLNIPAEILARFVLEISKCVNSKDPMDWYKTCVFYANMFEGGTKEYAFFWSLRPALFKKLDIHDWEDMFEKAQEKKKVKYVVSFRYSGPKVGYPVDGEDKSLEASRALSDANRYVEDSLTKAGLPFTHAYCWTDGSLYKYIEVPISEGELYEKLIELFKGTDIRVLSVSQSK